MTKVRVISAYKGMNDYVKEAKASRDHDLKALWDNYVINPYWNQWAAGQFNEQRIREVVLSEPIGELDKLLEAVELLSGANVEAIVEKVFYTVSEALPLPEEEQAVCIYINPYIGEANHGVIGTCVGDNLLLQINPCVEEWKDYIGWVVAHEHHHSVFGYNYFYLKGNTGGGLLLGLIMDGQADLFAKSLFPHLNARWIDVLTEKQELELWNVMKEHLDSEDGSIYERFFFGDAKTDTPPSTAYTVGYHILNAYMKAYPQISTSELLDKDIKEILKDSGYAGKPVL